MCEYSKMKICLLILLLDVSACWSAKSVADFSFVTWNADGGHSWNAAKYYFLQSNVDLMTIQAAAELPHYPETVFAVPAADTVPTKYLGATASKVAFKIDEYLWNLTDHDQVYLYYYTDRSVSSKKSAYSSRLLSGAVAQSGRPSSGAHNLAVLSRHKAHKLFLLPNEDEKSAYPLMGLRIDSTLFLTFCCDDDATLVQRVTNITAAHHPTLTWALTGGFQRTSADLIEALAQLPPPPANTFRRVVATGAATRVGRPWDRRRSRRNRKHRRDCASQNVEPGQLGEMQHQVAAEDTALIRSKHRKRSARAALRRRSHRIRKVVVSREQDYAIFGGPFDSRHIMKWVNVELLKNYFVREKITKYTRNPSHHLPLVFNKHL